MPLKTTNIASIIRGNNKIQKCILYLLYTHPNDFLFLSEIK